MSAMGYRSNLVLPVMLEIFSEDVNSIHRIDIYISAHKSLCLSVVFLSFLIFTEAGLGFFLENQGMDDVKSFLRVYKEIG